MRFFNILKPAFVCFSILLTSFLAAQTVVRGPYLQTPTQNSIIIKWRTNVATNSRVSYGTSMGNLSQTKDDNASTTEHTVKLTGLSVFTEYYYSVGSTSQTLSGPDSLHHFKTSPVPGTVQPIRIWAIGDFGKANTGEQNVRDSYLNYSAGTHTDVWLWLGDNAYDNGTDQQYQDKVFDYNYYGQVMKFLPFWPCPGNHDYESVCAIPCTFGDPTTHTGPYFDMIDVPKNGEAGGVASGYELYYSFDYGNVHFISLNSELGALLSSSGDWNGVYGNNFSNSPVHNWLVSDLTANTKPWVIVYFHQPPYTKGSHDSDSPVELYMKAMRENYVPIFDQFQVDLVVCGHSHVYERSFMLKGHTGNSSSLNSSMIIDGSNGYESAGNAYIKDTRLPSGSDGTVYIVVGCSGSLESGAALNHPVMVFGNDVHGSLVIDVNDNRLDSRFLAASGTTMDHFTMMKVDAATHIIEYGTVNSFQVYPNPFTNQAEVRYHLNNESLVSLKVYDVQGRTILTLFEGNQQPGNYTYSIPSGSGMKKGVYLVKLMTGDDEHLQKVMSFE